MQVGVIDTTPRMGPSGKGAMITVNGNKYWCPVDLNPGGLVQGMGITFDTAFGWNDKETGTPIMKFTKIEVKANGTESLAPQLPHPHASLSQVTAAQAQGVNVIYLPCVSNTIAHAIDKGLIENPHQIRQWVDATETALRLEATTGDPIDEIPF